MDAALPSFRAPTAIERVFNRIFGFVVGMGWGFSYNYLLQVRGRKSGKIFSTPIDLLARGGKRFLVAPRGRTQWVRNAEAAGEVALKTRKTAGEIQTSRVIRSREARDIESLSGSVQARSSEILSSARWLTRRAFRELADNYPAFELISV